MKFFNRHSRSTRQIRQAVEAAAPILFDSLERRLLMAATPASVLTKANRQALLDGMTISTTLRTNLQNNLNANNVGQFDAALLTYSQSRANVHYFFAISEVPTIATYIVNNVGDGGSIT